MINRQEDFVTIGNIVCLYVEQDTDRLTLGADDGYVYDLDLGTADGPHPITMEFDSKEFHGGSEDIRKLFLWLKLDVDTQGERMEVEIYVDDTRVRSFFVTDDRTQPLIPFPAECIGYAWRVRLQCSSTSVRPVIYGLAAIWQMLRAA